jgi:hypothetical protein
MCEIDNTVADTNREIMKRVEGFDECRYPYPLPSDFFELNPDVLLGAAAFKGAAEALQRLAWEGYTLFYVTARPMWFQSLTVHWLRLNGFPQGKVVFTSNKRSIVERFKPTFMVDDSPLEIEKVQDLVEVLVPAKPYNKGYRNRFENWDQFPLLQRLASKG